jgi:hypothetical protein
VTEQDIRAAPGEQETRKKGKGKRKKGKGRRKR